jgi:hypothetical protein
MGLGQAGQQDGAQRRAEQAGGKFHQPVGIVEPGDAAGFEEGGEDGVDQQADLRHGNAQHGGRHQLEDALHALVAPDRVEARQHADPGQRGQLDRQLQHAAEDYRPGQGQDGGSNQGAANSAMPMKDRFSSTGVKAGRANRLQVLRTPAASATSDMNRM